MNKNTTSAAAERGSRMHALMEKHGSLVERHPEFELLDDDEQASHLILVADYLAEFDERASREGWQVLLEIELDLRSYRLPDCEFGTADRVDVLGSEADMFDYKFGRWAVTDAERNIQMWLYALGIFAKFKHVDIIRVHILQPALDTVSTATFTRDMLDMMWLRASTIYERRQQYSGVEFVPVASNCLWCANKAGCKAMHQMALSVKATFPMDVLNRIELSVDNMDSDSLLEYGAPVYDMTKLVEDWAKQMRVKITGLVNDGNEIRGKRMSQSGGKTSIMFPMQAVEIAAKMADKPIDEVVEAVMTVSVGKLDEVIGAAAPSGQKGKRVEEFRTQLKQAGLVYSSPPTKFLVDVK